ncbi:SIR2 family NAD-dependent protein deacylase [Thomasclavelia spiroformis]|uniref:SIR2 family NAD-dependent protein deacylase n=1 Tax=Thomasclavelia spiroformis TaxID=29348 RepID=UPI0039A0197D
MFLQKPIMTSTQIYLDNIYKLKNAFLQADAIIIGAGAGLSTAAGFTYDGKRFMKYFSDFHEKYGITNMYAGGFYPFDSLEEYWAYWSRYIYINRYQEPLKPVYQKLYQLVKNKDHFVLTTNVDHCFQKAGFDKQRLFYTQGDYGLFQCSKACQPITYDNEKEILNMVSKQKEMKIPTQAIPYCPHCGALMTMNLRIDDTFVEDKGWYQAAKCYHEFLKSHKKQHILFLELGVGNNTPGIIKYPFWNMTLKNKHALYACINVQDTYYPKEIKKQTICIQEDIYKVIKDLQTMLAKDTNN